MMISNKSLQILPKIKRIRYNKNDFWEFFFQKNENQDIKW